MRTLQHLAALIARHAPRDGVFDTPLPRTGLVRSSVPTEPVHTFYPPSFCLVAQGRKQVTAGGRVHVHDTANYLVVGMDLPVIGAVLAADGDAPYLALRLELDRTAVAESLSERAAEDAAPAPPVMGTAAATPDLIDAAARLLELIDDPAEAPFLARLVEREIVHRLLAGPYGAVLRQIAAGEGRVAQIDRAVRHIRAGFRRAMPVEELAAVAGMSVSAFHAHFRAVTSMTPLQFRNHIRLQEARRLMIVEGRTAAEAGFAVGYDSPSQFSRDYARVHSVPPRTDVARLRERYADLGLAQAAPAG